MAIWKTVEAFPNYEVSDQGQIRRVGSSRPLAPLTSKDGYYGVRPFQNGVGVSKKIHRLVALAFIPLKPGKPEVNHKNGIKTDNRVENLEWVSRSENNLHTRRTLGKMVGEKIPTSKLTDDAVRHIRSGTNNDLELAKIYGVNRSVICRVRLRQSWMHLP